MNSIEQILSQLETQPGWEKFRQHRQLLKCWDRAVNRQTADHTRPLYVNRQILYVATSSSARAQELSFQRYTLLKRLNKLLTFKIKDIRFSSFQWHQTSYCDPVPTPIFTISDRQSRKLVSTSRSVLGRICQNGGQNNSQLTAPERAKLAAQRWLALKQNQQASTLCPKCGSATSSTELNRWNMCHHCVAQKWTKEYRPATFPETE